MEKSIVQKTLEDQRRQWAVISQQVFKEQAGEVPLESPKRIILFGVGSSHFVAQMTALSLQKSWFKNKTQILACQSLAVGAQLIPARGDWCIGFSHRGKTAATLKGLQACDRMGALTFLVTGKNPDLSQELPPFIKFHIQSAEMETVEPHTSSVTGAFCAASTLLLGAEVFDEWQRMSQELNPDLEQCRERVMIPDPKPPHWGKESLPLWIIGETEGEWLARETALKLMEMAFVPARAFGSEEFFHGPRYAFKKDDWLWHFSTEADQRNVDIHPTLRISVESDHSVSFVSALVEAQWLCLAVALNLGIDPDSAGQKG